jgi:hypothetical protein
VCIQDDAATKTTIVVIERAATIKKLEADAKNAVASACHAFLSSKRMEPQSSTMADIIQEVSNNLFIGMIPQVAANSPPQQLAPQASPGVPPTALIQHQ